MCQIACQHCAQNFISIASFNSHNRLYMGSLLYYGQFLNRGNKGTERLDLLTSQYPALPGEKTVSVDVRRTAQLGQPEESWRFLWEGSWRLLRTWLWGGGTFQAERTFGANQQKWKRVRGAVGFIQWVLGNQEFSWVGIFSGHDQIHIL